MPRNKQLKLLYLVTEDWYFCSHRLALGRAAAAAGYEVTVATRIQNHGRDIRDAGLQLVGLPWERRTANAWNELNALFSLYKLYRNHRPDLVHHVALKPVLYGSLVARLTNTRRIINAVAGFGYSFVADDAKAAMARRVLKSSFKHMSNRPGARVLVQNPDDERVLVENDLVDPGHVTVIPGSGVDVDRFSPSPEGEPVGTPRVTLVSRMLWSKGVAEFVEAARLLKEKGVELEAVLVGDPDPDNPQSIPEKTLRQWHEEGAVVWWGHEADIPTVWARSNVAVLPSHREGLPKTLLEAAACGRAMVATDVPGCREIVSHGRTGLLVPAKDPPALARAVEQLISNPRMRKDMGDAARAEAVEKFSESIVIERVLALYRSMLEAR
jgi:glycosyltransferase involved in cell wall biosynthesis